MKKTMFLFLLALALTSCKKDYYNCVCVGCPPNIDCDVDGYTIHDTEKKAKKDCENHVSTSLVNGEPAKCRIE